LVHAFIPHLIYNFFRFKYALVDMSKPTKNLFSCFIFPFPGFHPLPLFFAALILWGLGLSGCESKTYETLPRTELFSIRIGKMEDEIDLFQFPQVSSSWKTSVFMRDGTFYVASGSSQKVMEFTSHGDLLSMYYNPDENPQPVMLQNVTDGGAVSNRRAYPYAFYQVGEIAVSRSKMLYVEDRLPDERAVEDEELGIKLNTIVLRFENGEYRGYLGQEGIGGNPFPYIQGMYILNQDEISILCRTMTEWLVFWYSAAGERLEAARISPEELPVPEGEGLFSNLETIIPDPRERVLYLKIDYYREGKDNATGIKYGIEDLASRIYRFDVKTGRYESFVDVPRNVKRERGGDFFDVEDVIYSYEFIGVDGEGNFFLKSREEGNIHQILILAQEGQALRRHDITIEDSELLFSVFHVSAEGILSALLASETGARVVWWRSDALLRDI
jgi:hypothetical protein